MVVVGGGAAGVFGAIRAKNVAPNLSVVVIEQGKPLSKVQVHSEFSFPLVFRDTADSFYSDVLPNVFPLCIVFRLNVLLGMLYWQVKVSGGGRCNVTNGHCLDNMVSFGGSV